MSWITGLDALSINSQARPSARPSQPPRSTHVPVPATTNDRHLNVEHDQSNEKKRWSDTQASRTPSRQRRAQSIEPRARRSVSVSERSATLSRSNSLSTLDGGLNPATGAYKVIINQRQEGSQDPHAPSMPAIEVPIPSYRLGTPRFSTRGTAFLHSTVYSTSPIHDDSDSIISRSDVDGALPAGPTSRDELPQQPGSVPQLHTVHVNPSSEPKRVVIPTSTPVFHRSKEPITPSIYDAIADNPDNPAIVRYAIMSRREISAASPARIIAQITSKNFLDYELLSDFFLTARAYLSTHDLLAYLLTRFEWAINRFDDDGRVIRVRAFAAIRHWVLNYFPYDFVVDRELRVKFCERLNRLAWHVRQRAPQEASDLKLILDLKKCWNGRCALYWDHPNSESEGRHDLDISPGGIVGSRDSRLTHPSELWAKLAASSSQQLDQEKSVAALHNWVDSVIEAEVDGKSRSERQASFAAPNPQPTPPPSDPSVPAGSCSVPPGRTFKSFVGQTPRGNGPHPSTAHLTPVPRKVGVPPRSGPFNDKTSPRKAEHDRSGSFSDALRDRRTSLPMGVEQSKEQIPLNVPFSGSLIRGNVLPPGSPFIENLHAQGAGSNAQKHVQYARMLDSAQIDSRPMSPGVRNLLTNLRRAWGHKQSSNSHNRNLLSASPFPAEKNAALPMHIAKKIEGFGDQHHQLEALKKNSRIDLLCADITAVFERIMAQGSQNAQNRPESMSSIGEADDNTVEDASDLIAPHREGLVRNHSAMTTGSRSILIVDDTSSDPPVPQIPHEFHNPPPAEYSLTSAKVPFKMSSFPDAPAEGKHAVPAPPNSSDYQTRIEDDTQQLELLPSFIVPSLPNLSPEQRTGDNAEPSVAAKSRHSNHTNSVSLRKYASFQSGMRTSRDEYAVSISSVVDSSPIDSSPHPFERAPKQMLRRRPGGDLRANETVHDMEPILRPRSTGSITTKTDSMHYSLKRSAEDPIPLRSPQATQHSPPAYGVPAPKAQQKHRPDSPRKERRPSFEAAVAEFRRIPDEEGGDLEATLAKLEGKFRKSPVSSPRSVASPSVQPVKDLPSPDANTTSGKINLQRQGDDALAQDANSTPPGTAKYPRPSNGVSHAEGARTAPPPNVVTKSLYAASEDSYNPMPLLERNLNGESMQYQNAVAAASNNLHEMNENANPYPSLDEISGIRRGRYRSSVPTATTDSFLLDDDESLSDLSSDLSDDEDDLETNSVLEDAFASSAQSLGSRTLPANAQYASGYLPSPPMTNENAAALKSEAHRIQEQKRPPTPQASPVSRVTESSKGRTPGEVDESVLQPFANKVHQFPTRRHIPFILAFDPVVLAQQFTIIERDALNEINWQDLIEMRWNNASSTTLNWVEYLYFSDPSGIELVTARFNLVVKWAQSEIVLTHNTEERALAMIKFIQIAQYARKVHNYATMLQLVIAMTSTDCSRLTKSWALVPEPERAALKEMEKLVSPLRNFHNLRAEMDTENLEDGCIPVVGSFPFPFSFLPFADLSSSPIHTRLDL